MCKQKPGESVDQFVIRLQQLSKQCDFQNVTAENYRLELMRDALIAGLSSPIRLRLLENRNLAFQEAYDQARTQELAYKNSKAYQSNVVSSIATINLTSNNETEISEVVKASTFFHKSTQLCFFFVMNIDILETFALQKMVFVVFVRKVDILRQSVKNVSKIGKIIIWKITTIYLKPYKFSWNLRFGYSSNVESSKQRKN